MTAMQPRPFRPTPSSTPSTWLPPQGPQDFRRRLPHLRPRGPGHQLLQDEGLQAQGRHPPLHQRAMSQELLVIQARSIIDFGASYDVPDPTTATRSAPSAARASSPPSSATSGSSSTAHDRESAWFAESSRLGRPSSADTSTSPPLLPPARTSHAGGPPVATFKPELQPLRLQAHRRSLDGSPGPAGSPARRRFRLAHGGRRRQAGLKHDPQRIARTFGIIFRPKGTYAPQSFLCVRRRGPLHCLLLRRRHPRAPNAPPPAPPPPQRPTTRKSPSSTAKPSRTGRRPNSAARRTSPSKTTPSSSARAKPSPASPGRAPRPAHHGLRGQLRRQPPRRLRLLRRPHLPGR